MEHVSVGAKQVPFVVNTDTDVLQVAQAVELLQGSMVVEVMMRKMRRTRSKINKYFNAHRLMRGRDWQQGDDDMMND